MDTIDIEPAEIKDPLKAPVSAKVITDQPGNNASPHGAIEVSVSTDDVTDEKQAAPPAEPAEPKADRPAWLPPGYDTPEAFVDAWKAGKAAPPAPEQLAVPSGVDMDTLTREYAEKGALSPESVAKLEKAGIKRNVVDAYIEGQKAQAAARDQRVLEAIGGQAEFDATVAWARQALTAQELASADSVLKSGDEAASKLVLQGLNARRIAVQGREPSLLGGRASPGRGEGAYESLEQMLSDMGKPEYDADPAFRDKVERRVKAGMSQR